VVGWLVGWLVTPACRWVYPFFRLIGELEGGDGITKVG